MRRRNAESVFRTGRSGSFADRRKISERKIFPCVFGSALRMEGVKHLLEVMQTFLLEPSYDEVFGAKVFKIMRDDKGARLTYVKVTGGQLKPRMELSDKKVSGQKKLIKSVCTPEAVLRLWHKQFRV